MMLAAIVLAAIMTESNGTFSDAPTGAAVSVSSPYIPYGTYTDGSGSTEYMRVTTNLVGAVASMIDGFWERVALPYGWLPGEYPFREEARDTKRILAAALNSTGNAGMQGVRQLLEESLAGYFVYESTKIGPGGQYLYSTNAMHAGVAGAYLHGLVDSSGLRYRDDEVEQIAWSSRKAESFFSDVEDVPVSRTWTALLPFRAEASELWRNVLPAYSACEYDEHFFRTNDSDLVATEITYGRPHVTRWMRPNHLDGVWGVDVWGTVNGGTGWELDEKLRRLPVSNFVYETVLKDDPGFDYVFPPVETNSWWDVVGDLGSFRCELVSDYGPNDRYYEGDGSDTNYYCEVWISSGSDSAWIDVAVSRRGVGRVFYGWDYYHGEDSVTVWGDGYQPEPGPYTATVTRFVDNRDDFAHWRNMTTRLDWKRLGIVAQVERHLETTYRVREREDYLPLWEFFVRTHRNFDGSLPLHVKIQDSEIAAAHVVGHEGSLSLQYATWSATGETAEAQTNRLSASYPTARTIVNLDGAKVSSVGAVSPFSGDFSIRDDGILEEIETAFINNVDPWPSGVRHFRADLNLAPDGVGIAALFIWYGPDDVRGFSVGGSPVFRFRVPDTEADATFPLSRDDAKIARDVTTLANNATQEYKLMGRDIPAAWPGMSDAAVSNLEARLWGDGYIKKITLPTIEVRLAASNDYWAAQLDAEPVMPYIGSGTNANVRAFRYQCDVRDSATLDGFRGDRLLSLRDLDAEVKAHFKAFAGRDVATGLAPRAQFTAAERAAFDAAVANANAVVSLNVQAASHDEIWVEGDYDFGAADWHAGDVATMNIVVESGVGPATNSYALVYGSTDSHAYGSWSVVVSAQATAAITNSGARVDGHQNQMSKTLWKFKNLRDPDL